jgi:hypothetical protein
MQKKTFLIVAALAGSLTAPTTVTAQQFSNDSRSCDRYGAWAVSEILRAQSKGCDVRRANERLEPAFHANWCRRQSLQTMSNAANVHKTGVAFRCARQGVRI